MPEFVIGAWPRFFKFDTSWCCRQSSPADIRRADQISYEQCLLDARALIEYCRRLGLPFGINVESLTNRKLEIEASIDLAREIRDLLG